MKNHIENVLAVILGMMFVGLAILVAVDVVLRKTVNISLQGTDELGGYALAVGSVLSFALALFGRNHMRVDVVHERLPALLQGLLNWFAALGIAAFAALMAYLGWGVLADTMAYQSTAQTPWATPLVYPQGVWFAGLVAFALVACAFALRASWLLLRGRLSALNHEFQPKSAKEELDEELEDLATRQDGEVRP